MQDTYMHAYVYTQTRSHTFTRTRKCTNAHTRIHTHMSTYSYPFFLLLIFVSPLSFSDEASRGGYPQRDSGRDGRDHRNEGGFAPGSKARVQKINSCVLHINCVFLVWCFLPLDLLVHYLSVRCCAQLCTLVHTEIEVHSMNTCS